MEIRYASSFKRMFRKLSLLQQERVAVAIKLFALDPFNPRLRNHKLIGSQEGVRSISAGYDLRILYVEQDNHAVVFLLMVGTHDDVY